MNLVCLGIGGSGAACVEATVHLAALGVMPAGTTVVPLCIDPDQGHPRIEGIQSFVREYEETRRAGGAVDLRDEGFLGTEIVPSSGMASLRPAQQDSLFGVLGLADQSAASLVSLFFSERERGAADSHEFQNGFYGRANAGVCFFSAQEGKQRLMELIGEQLRDARVVLFGSFFGGTGNSGLLHVANTIRALPDRPEVPIAAVELEPYFEPEVPSALTRDALVNLPETFERRTQTAYEYLYHLASSGNLPARAFYLLGTQTAVGYPHRWFKRDQQDNPAHWVEYLAALAARDFAAMPSVPRAPHATAWIRKVAHAPFGDPLDALRKKVFVATCTHAILGRLVLPVLRELGRRNRVAGHPWVHSLLEASELDPPALTRQFDAARRILHSVLSRLGVVSMDRADAVLKQKKALESLPAHFLEQEENLRIAELLRQGNPAAMLDGFSLEKDRKMPSRALFRWVEGALSMPKAPDGARTDGLMQLRRQKDDPSRETNDIIGLPAIDSDRFFRQEPADLFKRLKGARWATPGNSSAPRVNEYPTIWAPALVYEEQLYSAHVTDDERYLHLGLLFTALIKYQKRHQAPVFWFDPEAKNRYKQPHYPQPLRDVLKDTFPLGGYEALIVEGGGVLALSDRRYGGGPEVPPRPEQLLAFFYPSTVLVPSQSLSAEMREDLLRVGRDAARKQLPALLLKLPDWPDALKASGVARAAEVGSKFRTFLQGFSAEAGQTSYPAEDRYPLPTEFRTLALWIQRLYELRPS